MAWTAPPVVRTVELGSLGVLPERQMLEGWLQWHRETLMAKCAGLSSVDLARTTVAPSTLSLLGLVRHMAEIERWWFRRSFAGEALGCVFTGPEDGNEGLDGVEAANAARAFELFRTEIRLSDAAAAGRDLDETFRSAGESSQPAVGLLRDDPGVRPAQRARRPPAGAYRRGDG